MSHLGSPARAYDFLLKFLLVGDSDVGKGEILAGLQGGAAEAPYGHHMGRVSFFTSGSENLHRVEKVRWGTRYAITISFTCNPDHSIEDPVLT